MEIQRNCTFIRRGKKYNLRWVQSIAALPEPFSEWLSPIFYTKEKEMWQILLWTGFCSKQDYIFCTLIRKLDEGPSKVQYSVNCQVCIGPETSEDIRWPRQPSEYKTFSQGSTEHFRLLPLSDIRNSVSAFLSRGPVKLIIQISLQRKPYETFQTKRLHASTELGVITKSFNHSIDNHFYQGKEKENVSQQPENSSFESEWDDYSMVNVNYPERPNETLWHPVTLKLNQLNFVCKCRCHFLDVNGLIHASSTSRIYESTTQRVEYPVYIMKMEDSLKQRDTLSRDGEITIRMELTVEDCKKTKYVNCEWTLSSFPVRNKANIREDLKHLLFNCPKGTNLQIKVAQEVLKVHRGIIAARSPVFNAMMSHNMIEKLSNVIEIQGIDTVTLRNFLDYLYSGAFDYHMKWEDACNLYAIADKYFVRSLCHISWRKLTSSISFESSRQFGRFFLPVVNYTPQ